MQPPSTILAQITAALFPSEFARCVELFPTPRPTRGLTAYDQFLAFCFGQLTYRDSLRDIVTCLKAKPTLLYHLGFRGNLSRTNLAYANHHRDWRVFEAIAQVLMRRAARLYRDHAQDSPLPRLVLALDSSIISLSLNLFPWGYYARSKQAALKLHLALSLRGNLPVWATMTEATFPDMKILDRVPILPQAYYVMDRGYLDFQRLFRIHQGGGYFVVRNKNHVRVRVLASTPVDKKAGLRCDQKVRLKNTRSAKSFPHPLRRVRVYDPEHKVTLVLLTNQFELPTQVIAELYRKRWQVELFFKWIKQHLRLRSFYGRSPNAVRSQIWSAISAYLMVAIVRKNLNCQKTLNEILQIVSVNIFEQVPLQQLLADNPPPTPQQIQDSHPQNMFSFNG